MRRRDFLALAGAAAVLPRALADQNPKLPRLAFVHPAVPVDQMTETSVVRDVAAFLRELRRLGLIDGSSVLIERWSGNGDPTAYEVVTRSAVASNPDVIYVSDTQMSQIAVAATATIPIVSATGDLLADGVVTNLSHPGGNVTGFNSTVNVFGEIGTRMAVLRAALPSANRVGCISSASSWETFGGAFMDAGSRLGLEIVGPVIPAAPFDERSYRTMFSSGILQNVDVVHLVNGAENAAFGSLIGGVAAAVHKPGISYHSAFVDGGGLMSYGPNFDALYRGAAGQVAQILKGAKPGDLPVVLPQRFNLTINLSAAKDLSLVLPQRVIDAATELRQ